MCMVGVERHWVEKDVVKFLRKFFTAETKPQRKEQTQEQEKDEEVKKEEGAEADIPLKAVAKKRN